MPDEEVAVVTWLRHKLKRNAHAVMRRAGSHTEMWCGEEYDDADTVLPGATTPRCKRCREYMNNAKHTAKPITIKIAPAQLNMDKVAEYQKKYDVIQVIDHCAGRLLALDELGKAFDKYAESLEYWKGRPMVKPDEIENAERVFESLENLRKKMHGEASDEFVGLWRE